MDSAPGENVGRGGTSTLPEREQILLEGKAMGTPHGAQHVHRMLDPLYWGVSLEQLREFVADVRNAVEEGSIVNTSPKNFVYSASKFEEVGPNMHQVNHQFIKPRTGPDTGQSLACASYAVMLNHESGLECDLFYSHAWDEGVYQFGEVALSSWPEECTAAYICFLSNPQNLDISELLATPQSSPFYRVLQAGVKGMVMASNSNTPIHSRLWCVYEAFTAETLGITVSVAGNSLYLLPECSRAQAESALVELFKAEKQQALVNLKEDAKGTESGQHDKERHEEIVKERFEQIALDVRDARCSSKEDADRIWAELKGHEDAVNAMIKEQMLASAVGLAKSKKVLLSHLKQELQIEQNKHHKKSFRGFGKGQEYDESEEAAERQASIQRLKDQVEQLDNAMVSEMSGIGTTETADDWRDGLRANMEAELRCLQCNQMFYAKDNSESACRYHTRGGGTIFDWDEDDFIFVPYTCCEAKSKDAPGCEVGMHNSEDGMFSDANANREWSSAHM